MLRSLSQISYGNGTGGNHCQNCMFALVVFYNASDLTLQLRVFSVLGVGGSELLYVILIVCSVMGRRIWETGERIQREGRGERKMISCYFLPLWEPSLAFQKPKVFVLVRYVSTEPHSKHFLN